MGGESKFIKELVCIVLHLNHIMGSPLRICLD